MLHSKRIVLFLKVSVQTYLKGYKKPIKYLSIIILKIA